MVVELSSGGALASARVYAWGAPRGVTVGRLGGINMNRVLNSMEDLPGWTGRKAAGPSSLRRENRGTFFHCYSGQLRAVVIKNSFCQYRSQRNGMEKEFPIENSLRREGGRGKGRDWRTPERSEGLEREF